jgi:uncharacterized protein (TIGR02118 family)
MAVSYLVSYAGTSADETAFHARYRDVHAPILRTMPGIQSLILHRPVASRDPFPVIPGGLHLLAQLVFPSVAALDGALASEARRRARADFAAFPAFTGTVFHQAMESQTVF